jgi:ADP-heptose:LPS heptosyltransferase
MRIVEIVKPFTNAGIKYEAGKKMVMAEDVEGSVRAIHGDKMGMSYPIEGSFRKYEGQDLTNKRLMAFRSGGVGDLAFLSPVFRYLKKKYPGCFIRVATGCRQPLEGLLEIDELYDMPFEASLLSTVDFAVFFQGILESGSEVSKRTHAVDMFFSYFGIDSLQFPKEDKVPRLYFKKEELDWLKQTTANIGIKDDNYVIGIQMEPSAPVRTFPKEKMKPIVDLLSQEENAKVVLIGSEQQEAVGKFFKGNNPNVILATRYTVRQSIVLANRYDLVISPDTFMVQVAGALDKPQIGLYGPFPSEVRMKYFKNAIGLDPSTACTPCFKHDFRPCVKGNPSPCFSQINVDDILQAADYLKFKFTGAHFKYMAPMLREPDLSEVEKYMMSADKGLVFFPRYYRHPNAFSVDVNPYVKADISDLSTQFNRESYPFVLYFNEIQPKYINLFNNSKGFVRPGGYFIAYKEGGTEQFFEDMKKDLGRDFVLMFVKFDPSTRVAIVVGKKNY